MGIARSAGISPKNKRKLAVGNILSITVNPKIQGKLPHMQEVDYAWQCQISLPLLHELFERSQQSTSR